MLTRLDDLVRRGAPERPAVTFKDRTLTYAELDEQVRAAAAGLRALGLDRGDRVLVYLGKRLETVVALFAASAAGLVVVPVNPLLKARQVGFIAADCAARAVVTSPERLQTLRGDLPETVVNVVVVGAQRPEDGEATAVTEWTRLCRLADAESQSPVTVIDADIAAILYTSGSTGTPKGVVLSHRNLLVGAESVAGYLGHTADDVVLSVLPLSFDAGLSQVTTALHAGAHVVLVNFLLAREVPKLCAKHRVTALTCVPPLWMQLAEAQWPAESAAHLRYFANTGGHMPRATLDRLREIFPKAEPFLMYGLTEAFRSTYLDPAEIDRRPDSIGKAIPNAEVLVVRADGTPCEAGEEGEIVHRGALVALGYWNDPVRTAERFRALPRAAGAARAETAVWSGDRAVRDADGFLYFRGRADEMIKTSGYRVSPTEVEAAAHATGLVAEAAAFGVPDETLGQHIVLVAAPAPDAGTDPAPLLAALRGHLPAYMLPRRIEFLDRLPRSANGKFDRALLRERTSHQSEDEMGLVMNQRHEVSPQRAVVGGGRATLVGVVGAGVMGVGVAQNLAQTGHDVILVDKDEETLRAALALIERNCRMSRLMGGPEVDAAEVLARITTGVGAKQVAGAEIVIENVTENWDVKRAVHEEMDAACGPETVFVVNTSAIPITKMAAVTGRPDRVVGVHFMNPVPAKPAVELIPGFHTSPETVQRTRDLLTAMGKKAVQVKDSCGFVSNRVLMLTVNEAAYLVHEGVASAADVDEVFRSCFGHPMGPLETADLIGVDTILYSVEVLYEHYADSKYRPCPLLKQMTDAGLHGRKSGRGFHDYDPSGRLVAAGSAN